MTGFLDIKDMTARDIAVLALRDRDGNTTAHLERTLAGSQLPPSERGLARELTLGTLRRRATVRAILRAFLQQPDRQLPGLLNEILEVAIYQIIFLDRIPEFAAVNEAVKAAERFQHRRQSGLVNGILRTLTRSLLPAVAGRAELSRSAIPITPSTFRRCKKDVFADPKTEPAEYVAAAHSLPVALAQRWIERLGMNQAIELAYQANVRAPLILRVNSLKTSVPELLEKLQTNGVACRPHANGMSIVLDDSANVVELPGFGEGLFQPQDATASSIAQVCSRHFTKPPAQMKVLDFCAAPGTKTTHIAEHLGNKGSILALDISDEKLGKITSNCARMGVTNVTTRLSEQAGGLEVESFDLVLADVPCSNTGVLSRRPESRWRFDQKAMRALANDQQILIQMAANFTARGGRLVYSTCSIEPEECQQVAKYLLGRMPRARLIEERLTLPGGMESPEQWHDGGYYAVFEMK